MSLLERPHELAAPGAYPVPPGRGRWRLTMHGRHFAPAHWSTTVVAEPTAARSRRLEQSLNGPARLTFTIDGRAPEAALVSELQQDVYAWRWDDQVGADRCVGRFVVAQSEDEVTEQAHVVIFTAHDYLALFERRLLTTPVGTLTTLDQDAWVAYFLTQAKAPASSSGVAFAPAGYLPLSASWRAPGGQSAPPGAGVPSRDRTYSAGSGMGELVANMAALADGYDYDVVPAPATAGGAEDELRVFFPAQGVERPFVPLVYGSTVSGLTRSVNSADYANYWRVVGSATPADPGDPDATEGPPMFAEAWSAEAEAVVPVPIGLWMSGDNAADVSDQSTLDEHAEGNLALSARLVPSYTLSLRPGAYAWGFPNMGDTCPLVVHSGRLNVETAVRVVGLNYSITDDGDEDVELVVGRARPTLGQLITGTERDVDALTRR